MDRDPILGGGRLGKRKRGWGHLPPAILQRIFDHTLDQLLLPKHIRGAWEPRPESLIVVSAISRRNRLLELRRVCLGWQQAADSSLFWPIYSHTLNPAKLHITWPTSLRSSQTASSRQIRSSPFRVSHRTTSGACHLCRINNPLCHPHSARPSNFAFSHDFGLFFICDRHKVNPFCSNCLRDDLPYKRAGDGRKCTPNTMIAETTREDEHGHRLQSSWTYDCRHCRGDLFRAEIERALNAHSIGDRAQGVCSAAQHESHAQDYVYQGFGSARSACDYSLSQLWLDQHADFDSFSDVAEELQKLENRVKAYYIEIRQQEPKSHASVREQVLGEKLWKLPMDDMRPRLRAFREHMIDLYGDWRDELEEGDIQPFSNDMSDYLYDEAIQAALFHFVRHRIRSGVWVSPLDEVRIHVETQPITPLQELCSASQLPAGVSHRPDRAYIKPSTFSHFLFDKADPISCFPPEDFLTRLEGHYRRVLKQYLRDPIELFVTDQAKAGRSFEHESPELSEVLDYITKHPECWRPFVRYPGDMDNPPKTMDHPPSPARSPRVELVYSSDEEEEELEGELENGFSIRSAIGIEHEKEEEEEDDADPEADLAVEQYLLTVELERTRQYAEERLKGYVVGGSGSDDEDQSSSARQVTRVDRSQHHRESGKPTLPAGQRPDGIGATNHPHENGNGKRKSPPGEQGDEVSTITSKRRLSNDGQIVDTSTSTAVVSTAQPDESTESRDSSPSGPTDPLPVTPDLLPDPLLTSLAPDAKGADPTEPPIEPALIALRDIPHIPRPDAKLGPLTEQYILQILEDVLAPIRACRCKICDRARRTEEARLAQLEVLYNLTRRLG